MHKEKTNETVEKVEPYSIFVSISSDYMTASIDIDIKNDEVVLNKADIMRALEQKNVVFGVHTHIIDDIVRENKSVRDIEIAKGIPIQNGQNGEITYNFDTERDIHPTINEDGSVDFKNTNFLLPTKRGDVLATRTMPTEGKDGTLVTGKIMKARDGRMVNFKIGKNVEVSEDTMKVISKVDGNIEFSGGTISVKHSLEINGDVGIGTGNIDFAGEVIIRGNVTNGYRVVATENIIVYGVVESAYVEAGKDLTINRGVQGKDGAVLKAGGDITAKFLNGATIECSGSVSTDTIMHSDVICQNSISVEGKNGLIVGGNIYSNRFVEAKCIGSRMGTTTFVAVGVTLEMLKRYQDLQGEIETIKKEIDKIKAVMNLLKQRCKGNPTEADKRKYLKSDSLKKEHEEKLFDLKLELDKLSKEIKNANTSYIKVGDVYPGVRLKVDNNYFSVKERILEVIFRKKNNEIVMDSWYEE